MIKFKNTEFLGEFKGSLTEFKKQFKGIFSEEEMIEAYEVATNGGIQKKDTATKKRPTKRSK